MLSDYPIFDSLRSKHTSNVRLKPHVHLCCIVLHCTLSLHLVSGAILRAAVAAEGTSGVIRLVDIYNQATACSVI
jgi:hypothetical protein